MRTISSRPGVGQTKFLAIEPSYRFVPGLNLHNKTRPVIKFNFQGTFLAVTFTRLVSLAAFVEFEIVSRAIPSAFAAKSLDINLMSHFQTIRPSNGLVTDRLNSNEQRVRAANKKQAG